MNEIYMDTAYWINNSWDVQNALKIVAVEEFTVTDTEDKCGLTLVELEDGRFYVGETFIGAAENNPIIANIGNRFTKFYVYDSKYAAFKVVIDVLHAVTQLSIPELESRFQVEWIKRS
jgi:hypothetical protein